MSTNAQKINSGLPFLLLSFERVEGERKGCREREGGERERERERERETERERERQRESERSGGNGGVEGVKLSC